MKTNRLFYPIFLFSLAFSGMHSIAKQPSEQVKNYSQKLAQEVVFTENKGQVIDQHGQPNRDVLFSGTADGMSYHLKEGGISYQLSKVDSWKEETIAGQENKKKFPAQLTTYRTDIKWVGANKSFMIEKGKTVDGSNNFYLDHSTSGITGIKSYESVTFKNIYEGIDVKWYSNKGSLEYDFIVQAGIDYQQIAWEIKGAEKLSINESGQLVIVTPLGEIRENAPIAFQKGKRVETNWSLNGNFVTFEIGNYNPTLALIIDPVVRKWGSYYGGSNNESFNAITTDDSLNIYLAGTTLSTSGIATSGAHKTVFSGPSRDAFLVKFNSDGVRQWATYYGGSSEESGEGCATDGSLNVYLSGSAQSVSLATPGSHQDTYNGGRDAYLAKFNSDGILQWATYYGGAGNETGWACATDANDNVYLSGSTNSTLHISTVWTGHQYTHGGGLDGFLVKFNSNGYRQWGTYYGGAGEDALLNCVTDAASNVYITGNTFSSTGISSPGSHQAVYGGNRDGFLVKFNTFGLRQWGTYYGGISAEDGYGIAADASLNVYLSGNSSTSTIGVIATPGSHQSLKNAFGDAFLVKFNQSGVREWGTYYGGENFNETAYSCAVDAEGNPYIAGVTKSLTNISTIDGHQSTFGGSEDGFFVKFNSNGTRQWASYYGGLEQDRIIDCAIDKVSNIYIAGRTESNFDIATPGSHQSTKSSFTDGFVAKFSSDCATQATVSITACAPYTSPSGNMTWTASGTYLDTLSNANGCDSLLTVHYTAGDTSSATYVVMGSSTPAGFGASHPDSIWVNRLRTHLESINANNQVINIAIGGTTSYHIMPTGFVSTVPSRPSPNGIQNITKALTHNPDGIIINMPNDDVSRGYSAAEELANYDSIVSIANAAGVEVWICTPQPKNWLSPTKLQRQNEVVDSVLAIYGDHAIDFWNGLAEPNGYIIAAYSAGDGFNLNDNGHGELFERVKNSNLVNACPTIPPVPGIDYLISQSSADNFSDCGDSSLSWRVIVSNTGIDDSNDVVVHLTSTNLSNSASQSFTDTIYGGLSALGTNASVFTLMAADTGTYEVNAWITTTSIDIDPLNDTLFQTMLILGNPEVIGFNDTVCSQDDATLTSWASSGATVRWYEQANNCCLIHEGPTLTINAVNAYDPNPIIRYVQAQRGNCFSEFKAVEVIANKFAEPQLSADTTLKLSDSLELDPGNFVQYLWSTSDTTPTIIVSGNSLGLGSHLLQVDVIDTNGCSGRDWINIQSIPDVPPPPTNCQTSESFKIVVMGSSTPAGYGPSHPDSIWVNRFRNYLQGINPANEVINIAIGGTTTYHIMPTGFVSPVPSRPSPNGIQNITKALTHNPDGIIINMPNDDVSRGYSATEELANYDSIVSIANAAGIKIWICTPQPKNWLSPTKSQRQTEVVDSVVAIYGDMSINFWDGLVVPSNGSILSPFSAGDGFNLNDLGHRSLFERVVGKNMLAVFCDDTTASTASVARKKANTENDDLLLEAETTTELVVFPNPNNGTFTIRIDQPIEGGHLMVFNQLGQVVFQKDYPTGVEFEQDNVQLNALAPGFYFIRFISENLNIDQKVNVLRN